MGALGNCRKAAAVKCAQTGLKITTLRPELHRTKLELTVFRILHVFKLYALGKIPDGSSIMKGFNASDRLLYRAGGSRSLFRPESLEFQSSIAGFSQGEYIRIR